MDRLKHVYNVGSLPPLDPTVQRHVEGAAERLEKKLRTMGRSLHVSESVAPDFKDILQNPTQLLKKYVHILSWSLYPNSLQEEGTFVDYGGGHGLMACLAKEAGIPHVVYSDIFPESCAEARSLGVNLGCVADEFVSGGINEVYQAVSARKPRSCALASINVIEHIYDFEEFLRVAASLSSGAMTMALSTSANPFNPRIRRRHNRLHLEWEFQEGPHKDEWVGRDTQRAFYNVRQEIIKERMPELSTGETAALATATRGLRKDDIEACVDRYKQTGQISVAPEHPTNTCDPLTGSWQERLLDANKVNATLNSLCFKVQVRGGYYDATGRDPMIRAAKRTVTYFLNHGISLLGKRGAFLAPCFMFHAARRDFRDATV
jgi:hypothetical protein